MKRLIRLFVMAALAMGLQVAVPAAAASSSAPSASAPTSCNLGNGVQHVINVVFDNTHFSRDNPNVPSDLEQMPALLNFLKSNGTLLTNEHTPLIAHTATDILTALTGTYGDNMGVPIANSFRYYLPNGKSSTGVSFAYWTSPLFDPTGAAGTDTTPNMLTAQGKNAPAPWVPFTRAGCDVGGVGTANIELENTSIDIPTVFGASSPQATEAAASAAEAAVLAAHKPFPLPPDALSLQAQTDFVGIAIHCGAGGGICNGNSNSRPDLLPDEPGGYNGFQGLFGAKYVDPAITGGSAAVNDTNGNPITDGFQPGFPGFDSMMPSNTLGYVATMQEHNVPVTYAYISDAHQLHPGTSTNPYGPGEAGYVAQLARYNQAFADFFARLAKDGINRSNTLFSFTSDEGDHLIAGPPSPAGCDGAKLVGSTVVPDQACTYSQIGEVSGDLKGLVGSQSAATTNFTVHSDSAPNVYINGNPSQTSTTTRDLERAVGAVTAVNPYSGNTEVVDNYLADQAEMGLLHMITADPKRDATFTMFAKPDYFLFAFATDCTTPCISVSASFNWNHGDIAPEINTTWLGLVGPGVRNLGATGALWTDHSDIRPTIMALTGLTDDYAHQGRPITEVMTSEDAAINELAFAYKQINAPVGQLSLDSVRFATKAALSKSAGDQTYINADATIAAWTAERNALAAKMIDRLDTTAPGSHETEGNFEGLIAQADRLLAEVHAAAA